MNVAILSSGCNGIDSKYIDIARIISFDLASRKFDLVFGGCSTSMMGACYNEFIKQNRQVHSYTTEKYTGDIINMKQAKHYIEKTTFDLKKAIFENSDLIVVLPGGVGTLSELLSFIEENRSNDKCIPIVVYNVDDYYKYLIGQLEIMDEDRFLTDSITKLITVLYNHDEWLDYIDKYLKKKGIDKNE